MRTYLSFTLYFSRITEWRCHVWHVEKLRVLPKRCDAKRNRCCFNLEPDLSKHEYITCSIPRLTCMCCILAMLLYIKCRFYCRQQCEVSGSAQRTREPQLDSFAFFFDKTISLSIYIKERGFESCNREHLR